MLDLPDRPGSYSHSGPLRSWLRWRRSWCGWASCLALWMVFDGMITPSEAIAPPAVSSVLTRPTLLASSLGVPPATEEPSPFPENTSAESLTRAALLDRLAASNVVYLGEYHDRVYDHEAQLEIIRELQRRNPKIMIAMEMFQRPFQEAIDAYLAGEIDEAELVDRTEYETRWGYPWELYAPILRWAREANIPVIAANAPAELTRKVAAEGLAGLRGEDFRDIPPIAEIRLDDADYRNALYQFFQMHMGFHSASEDDTHTASETTSNPTTNPSDNPSTSTATNTATNQDGFERFFAAQVLWDETMAEAIATAYHDDPDRQIIVIAGRGHIAYNFGIPSRVQRRVMGEPDDADMIEVNPLELDPSQHVPADPAIFVQTSVFFAQQDADRESIWPIPEGLERQLVDYFWSF